MVMGHNLQGKNHSSVETNKRLYPNILIKISNQIYKVRVDSGADISCLQLKIFKHLKNLNPNLKLESNYSSIWLADGKKAIKPVGVCTLRVSFAEVENRQLFYVFEDLMHPALLGMDWIWSNKVKIDPINNGLTYNYNNMPKIYYFLEETPSLQNIVYRVIEEEHYLPPFSHLESTESNSEDQEELSQTKNGRKLPSEEEMKSIIENFMEIVASAVLVEELVISLVDKSICAIEIQKNTKPILAPKTLKLTFKEQLKKTLAEESTLTPEESKLMETFLESHEKNFNDKPGLTKTLDHRIYTGDHPPVQRKPYKATPDKLKIIEEQVEEMLADGIIEECHSPWSSPVVLIKKPDSTMRFCIDFRHLNAVTLDDQFPMPSMESIVHQLDGATYLSALDLSSGYFQIPMYPGDRHKTEFVCHKGLFQFRVMPFGLKTAPSTFNRLMSKVLGSIKFALSYLDDVLVFSKMFAEHVETLLNLLLADGLFVKLKK